MTKEQIKRCIEEKYRNAKNELENLYKSGFATSDEERFYFRITGELAGEMNAYLDCLTLFEIGD